MTLGTQNDSKRSKLLVQCFLGHPWAVWRGTILVAYEYDLGRYHLIDAYQSVVTTLLGVVSVQYDWGWKASTGCPGKNTHMYTFIINVHTYECTCHVIYIYYIILYGILYIYMYIYMAHYPLPVLYLLRCKLGEPHTPRTTWLCWLAKRIVLI